MEGENTPDESDRDWGRIGLIACCLLAVVAASFLVPAFATDGLAGSPLDSVLPGEGSTTSAPAASEFGSGSGLGALNPGDATGVGGEIGLDSDTFATTDTEVHFTVESSQATYWRTGAFDRYTGSGWERTGDVRELEGSIEHDGTDGERIDYELTLEKSASGIPTAWRPSVVEGVDGALVTDEGAIRVDSPLEPGSTVEGVSFAPEDDVDQLRSAGESYPEEIETTYTQLPDDTPDRIGERTGEIIAEADAEGQYEAAVAVQEWLRSSKEYDLGVSERSENIADTFIFNMNAGYCEYFATSMVTMLRTQDIPSRYVVGYSTGQEVEDGVYEVRGMNAHAWVEVYFEDLGWVRFDPTPGNRRLAAQQEALEDVDGEFNLSEPGSPGEEFEPQEPEDDPDEVIDALNTYLNRTAIPGRSVEATATVDRDALPENLTVPDLVDWENVPDGELPLQEVQVRFNGEPVGVTDQSGSVVGTVPDADRLEITIREEDGSVPDSLLSLLSFDDSNLYTNQNVTIETENSSDDTAESSTAALSGADGTSTGPLSGGAGVGAGGPVVAGADSPELLQSDQNGTVNGTLDLDLSDSHAIEREITLVVAGREAPGETVTVTTRAGDETLPGTTVRVDGERVGETDAEGRIDLTLPERTGDISITAERQPLTGETTVSIPELSMTLESGPLGAYAFGSGTVTVELDDEPAAAVPVTIGGREVAVSGRDGTATVEFPLGTGATVAVEAAGQRESVTVSGLLYVPAAVGLVAVGLLLGIGYLFRRGSVDPRDALDAVVRLPGVVLTAGSLALVSGARRGDVYISAGARRLREVVRTVVGLFTGEVSVGEARARFGAWIAGLLRRVRGVLPGREEPPASEPMTVREAWTRFLGTISANRAATRTPGELAAHAIEEDGLPAEAVRTLRDTFREVEYGSRTASDRLEGVQEAIERIERTDDSDSGGP
jgi:transglutaminase-like putative cysteine protease